MPETRTTYRISFNTEIECEWPRKVVEHNPGPNPVHQASDRRAALQSSTCNVPGCESGGRITKGMCRKHYLRVLRYGSTDGRTETISGRNRCKPEMTLKQRIKHVGYTLTDSGCWEWNGFRHSAGYPMINWKRERTYIHRVALEVKLGRKLGPNMFACHHCDNPPCMNPDHLFEGTVQDNNEDMWNKGRGRYPRVGRKAGPRPPKFPRESFDVYQSMIETDATVSAIQEATGFSRSYVYALKSGRMDIPTPYREAS